MVEKEIRSGGLKVGDRIPSVNAFRIRFHLSRSSIFLAMEELKSRGIIEAVPAVGYFVCSTSVEVKQKVLLLFNELTLFKENLYRSILEGLQGKALVEIMFHHYDRHVFDMILHDAEGRYTSYVLMPGKFGGLAETLEHIPGQVFLLDHFQDDIRGLYPGVGQDFEQDTYDALIKALPQVQKYHTLILIQREEKEPEERYAGIRRFCNDYGFGHLLLPSLEEETLKTGTLYLTPSDRELVNIIKKAEVQHLEIGSDFGVISFNESSLKEVLCGGIATLSTDFRQMGRTLASLILDPDAKSQIPARRNPWIFVPRKSL